MARGKQAAKAANRRTEAAHDHIDRLTDQLVEAKARARRFEADASRLPAVEVELARVRRLADEGTSDALVRAQAAVVEARREVEDFRRAVIELFSPILQRIPSETPVIRNEDVEQFMELRIEAVLNRDDDSRELRRARANHRTAAHRGEHKVQDNGRTFGENVDSKQYRPGAKPPVIYETS